MQASPWYASRSFRTAAIVLLFGAVVVEGIVAILFRFNDFGCHLGWGRGFLEGDPYKYGGAHYPPGRILWNAGFAALDVRLARVASYAAAIGAWIATMRIWRQRLAREHAGERVFAAGALTFGLLYPYVIRDLDDCGLQAALLLLLTLGAGALHAGRPIAAAFWLALATTYKVTPALFWPLLLWKRQWRAAAWMPVCFILLNFAPAPFIGWAATRRAQDRFIACLTESARSGDPSHTPLEVPRVQNQSLSVALARLVQTYPHGHPLHLDHPLFVQLLDLDPAAANRVVMGVLTALALALAWRLRRPWRAGELPTDFAHQYAAVVILFAILSPYCWLQHLVLVLPAVWLVMLRILEDSAAGRSRSRGQVAAITLIGVVVLLLQRDVVGRELSLVVLSYKLDLLAALTALVTVLGSSRQRVVGSG